MTPRILRLPEGEVRLLRSQHQKAVVLVADDQAAEGCIFEIVCVGASDELEVLRIVTLIQSWPDFRIASLRPLSAFETHDYYRTRARTQAAWAEAATVSPFESEGA